MQTNRKSIKIRNRLVSFCMIILVIFSLAWIQFRKLTINPWLEDTATLLKWIDLFSSNQATYPPATLLIFGKFISFGVDVTIIQISYFIITYLIIVTLLFKFIGNWVIIFLLLCLNPSFNNLNSYLVALQPINFMIVIFLILQIGIVLRDPAEKIRRFTIVYYFLILVLGYMTSPHIMLSIVAVITIQLTCLTIFSKNYLSISNIFVTNLFAMIASILIWLNYLGSSKISINTNLKNAMMNGSNKDITTFDALIEQLKMFFSLKMNTFYFFENTIFVIINILFFLVIIKLISKSNQADLLRLTYFTFVFQIIVITGFVQFDNYKGRLGYIYLVTFAFFLTYLLKASWENKNLLFSNRLRKIV